MLEKKAVLENLFCDIKDEVMILDYYNQNNDFTEIKVIAKNRKKIESYLMRKKFKAIKYLSKCKYSGYIFLYPMKGSFYYYNKEVFIGVEVYCELFVHAYKMDKALIPLDRCINESLWETKKRIPNSELYELSIDNKLCFVIASAVFTKNKFDNHDIEFISCNRTMLYNSDFIYKLNMIFFQYTDTLIKELHKEDYIGAIARYGTFSKY